MPGPLLQSALDYVNNALQGMVDTIRADGEADSTAIILTAKHGQSPLNNNQLQRIDDGPIIAGVNAAWAATHPSNTTLVVQEADDDGLLWWLSDRSQAATDFVKNYLWTHSAPAVTTPARRSPSSIPACRRSTPASDRHNSSASRTPTRTIQTCSGSRRLARFTRRLEDAEHGGDNPGDRDVPLVVYAPGTVQPGQSEQGVETTQVAPTILKLLGLSPSSLQAVQQEGTQVYPAWAME